jgi:hypothetical protein
VRKQAKIDQTKLCPVVELKIREYLHPEWKKMVYNPILDIQHWIDFDEYDNFDKVGGQPLNAIEETPVEEAPAPTPAPRPAASPTPTARAAAAPAPQPVAGRRRPAVRTQPLA